MDIFKHAESLMRMSDDTWARHANPWSVYTRFAGALPVFFALWSAHWIGWWSLLPMALAGSWVYLNPRFFRAPKTADSWAARGVLGERAFLNRRAIPIPEEHRRVASLITALSGFFMLIGIWGLAVAEFWAAFAGWHASVACKAWFVDRMAWLWEEMKGKHPTYEAWAKADWSATFSTKEGRR